MVPTSDPQKRLCQFDTMENGIRAGVKNIITAYKKHGCNTISKLISRYAPLSENDTGNYIDFICKKCNVEPNDIVDLTDKTFLSVLVPAIIQMEQGEVLKISSDTINHGINSALS